MNSGEGHQGPTDTDREVTGDADGPAADLGAQAFQLVNASHPDGGERIPALCASSGGTS